MTVLCGVEYSMQRTKNLRHDTTETEQNQCQDTFDKVNDVAKSEKEQDNNIDWHQLSHLIKIQEQIKQRHWSKQRPVPSLLRNKMPCSSKQVM